MVLVPMVLLGIVGGLAPRLADLAMLAYYALAVSVTWLYFAGMESSARQATLGKRLMRTVVTDTAGQRISLGRATGRLFAKLLNGLTLGIGSIMPAFTAQKRALHDYAAGTLVVHPPHLARPSSALVGTINVVALGLPVGLGLLAAIVVPGLLRARMAGNEASAIGSLRAVHSAQMTYASQCNGYAPGHDVLGAGGYLSPDLGVAGVVVKSGYRVTGRGVGAPVATTCPGGAVESYEASAVPEEPGTTGSRYFRALADGTIEEATDPLFISARQLR
jgi:uncharacterized RDD family membrane protein YckC